MNTNKIPSSKFVLISWGITAFLVLGLLVVAAIRLIRVPVAASNLPTPTKTSADPAINLPNSGGGIALSISRQVTLKTSIPTHEPYDVIRYTVSRGDSLFGIAHDYNIKPETLYWANADVFAGSPDNINPGDVLSIPPTDGVYYKWLKGDTLETVAAKFKVTPDVILSWPGNNMDLTAPQVAAGTYVMIPGAKRDDQPLFIQTVTRFSTAGGKACGGGPEGRGYFNWPAINHYLSGYNFGDEGGTHKGIDIAATTGSPILAADNGVVTMAGWSQYGYGNVVMIDHGNGFVTLYGHMLENLNVIRCQSVLAGAIIGYAGSTGNSSGTHLHFEIRYNGVPVNPWNYLP